MSTPVTLLPGDYLGRDLADGTIELVKQAGGEIAWERIDDAVDEDGVTAEALASIRRNKVALKGPFRTPEGVGNLSPSVAFRKELDLYAGVRHVRNLAGVHSRYENVDLVVIRENTEDVYAGLEHTVHPGVVESIKVVTERASRRIFEFAYRYAKANGRDKLAIIHKANIMKQSDGLFLRTGRSIGAQNPEIETRALIVDNTCMQLVQWPFQFQVLVCGNLYGDIISDLAAGLVGGISAVWGVDRGDELAVFEMIHGRAPGLMKTDTANPIPMLLPAVHLLKHIGQDQAGQRLQGAIETVLGTDVRTKDLGGVASTTQMFEAIASAL